MTYTSLLTLSLALVAATGFSLQDSQSYNSRLSALSAMTDQVPVEDQPGYTGAIQRELEGLIGSSSVSRVRRNALREPEYFPGCCGSSRIYQYPNETTTTYPECHPDIINGGEIASEPYNLTLMCASYQCYAQKIGVVDGEGYMLPEAFANAASNSYTEDSLKTLAKQLAPDCVTEANTYVKKVLEISDNEERCNLGMYWAEYCVEAGITMGCPEDQKINNEECDEIREWMVEFQQDWKNYTQSN